MVKFKIKLYNSKEGVILIVVLLVMIAVSIYLPAYFTWSILDQRSLIRQQRADEAGAIAQAGLNRAVLDLSLDSNSWLDGKINQTTVHIPDPNSPDTFWTLYTYSNWTLPYGGFGSYTVWIDYLQNPKPCTGGCLFFDKRMRVRSTGTVPQATMTLEQYVYSYVVKNLTWDRLYASLQQAINEVIGAGRDNDTIGITATTLIENIAISAKNWTIQGCYAPSFTYRSCSDYHTVIQGNWTVIGTANINLSGITILAE